MTRCEPTPTYEIDTVKLDGSGLKANHAGGGWSSTSATVTGHPRGTRSSSPPMFRTSTTTARSGSSISTVAGLRQLPIAGPCGGLPPTRPRSVVSTQSGRRTERRSPSGAMSDDEQRDIYTVNADGSGLFQVTHTPNISEFNGGLGDAPAHAVTVQEARPAKRPPLAVILKPVLTRRGMPEQHARGLPRRSDRTSGRSASR